MCGLRGVSTEQDQLQPGARANRCLLVSESDPSSHLPTKILGGVFRHRCSVCAVQSSRSSSVHGPHISSASCDNMFDLLPSRTRKAQRVAEC